MQARACLNNGMNEKKEKKSEISEFRKNNCFLPAF